jgi:hypothetical protein
MEGNCDKVRQFRPAAVSKQIPSTLLQRGEGQGARKEKSSHGMAMEALTHFKTSAAKRQPWGQFVS